LLRIGVTGCGYWGPNLIRSFCKLKDSASETSKDAVVPIPEEYTFPQNPHSAGGLSKLYSSLAAA